MQASVQERDRNLPSKSPSSTAAQKEAVSEEPPLSPNNQPATADPSSLEWFVDEFSKPEYQWVVE